MKKDLRPEMNKKYNTIAAYVLIVAAIILLAISVMAYIVPISVFFKRVISTMNPFFYAFAIAFVLAPLCNFFERTFLKLFKKSNRKTSLSSFLSILITYILFFAFLTMFFYIIIPQATESVRNFTSNYKNYIAHARNFFEGLPSFSNILSGEFVKQLEEKLLSFLESALKLLTDISPQIISALSGFAVSVWHVVLGVIISIYMLAERKVFARQLKKLSYALFPKRFADGIISTAHVSHSVFGGFVTGKILESMLIGFLCFIGTSIMGIPYAPLVSIIVGVTDIIPYFGPFLGGIPSFIIILLNEPIKAIWFVIFIVILQQIDSNIIGPKILKETIGVSSFWIIFSLLVLGGLYGIVGMIIAVPLFALIHMGLSKMCNHLLDKKGHPENTPLEDFEKKEDGTQNA